MIAFQNLWQRVRPASIRAESCSQRLHVKHALLNAKGNVLLGILTPRFSALLTCGKHLSALEKQIDALTEEIEECKIIQSICERRVKIDPPTPK